MWYRSASTVGPGAQEALHWVSQSHNILGAAKMKLQSIRVDATGNLHIHDLKQKKVTFAGKVRCRTLQVSKKDAQWYSNSELKSFRSRDIKYIQTLITYRETSLTGNDDLEDVSFVGLLSETDHLERARRIREARECVLEEQLAQEEKYFSEHADIEGFQLDQEAIAEFYSYCSMTSSEVARIRGHEIFSHIERMWVEEKTDKKSDEEDIEATQRSCSELSSCSERSISISISTKKDHPPLKVRSKANTFRSLIGRFGRVW